MAYSGRNDILVWTDASVQIDVRMDGEGRMFQLIRIADGMPLEAAGALTDAQNRANAIVAGNENA